MKQQALSPLLFLLTAALLSPLVAAPMSDEELPSSYPEPTLQDLESSQAWPVEALQGCEIKNDPETFDGFSSKEDRDLNNEEEQYYQVAALSSDRSKSSYTPNSSLTTASQSELLQTAPPTKHPLERKTLKAVVGWLAIPGGLEIGAMAGCSVASSLGAAPMVIGGAAIVMGVVGAYLTIHYAWNLINYCFP